MTEQIQKYTVGQKVDLWQVSIDHAARTTCILKRVIVTITEAKVGVPWEHSRKSTAYPYVSLKAIADDGTMFEKNWHSWPEAQLRDYADVWDMRQDGTPDPKWNGQTLWQPKEAETAYNEFISAGKKHGFKLVGPDGKEGIVPEGDVTKCEQHGLYAIVGDSMPCLECHVKTWERKSA